MEEKYLPGAGAHDFDEIKIMGTSAWQIFFFHLALASDTKRVKGNSSYKSCTRLLANDYN
jgi:hypothetical protein